MCVRRVLFVAVFSLTAFLSESANGEESAPRYPYITSASPYLLALIVDKVPGDLIDDLHIGDTREKFDAHLFFDTVLYQFVQLTDSERKSRVFEFEDGIIIATWDPYELAREEKDPMEHYSGSFKELSPSTLSINRHWDRTFVRLNDPIEHLEELLGLELGAYETVVIEEPSDLCLTCNEDDPDCGPQKYTFTLDHANRQISDIEKKQQPVVSDNWGYRAVTTLAGKRIRILRKQDHLNQTLKRIDWIRTDSPKKPDIAKRALQRRINQSKKEHRCSLQFRPRGSDQQTDSPFLNGNRYPYPIYQTRIQTPTPGTLMLRDVPVKIAHHVKPGTSRAELEETLGTPTKKYNYIQLSEEQGTSFYINVALKNEVVKTVECISYYDPKREKAKPVGSSYAQNQGFFERNPTTLVFGNSPPRNFEIGMSRAETGAMLGFDISAYDRLEFVHTSSSGDGGGWPCGEVCISGESYTTTTSIYQFVENRLTLVSRETKKS